MEMIRYVRGCTLSKDKEARLEETGPLKVVILTCKLSKQVSSGGREGEQIGVREDAWTHLV